MNVADCGRHCVLFVTIAKNFNTWSWYPLVFALSGSPNYLISFMKYSRKERSQIYTIWRRFLEHLANVGWTTMLGNLISLIRGDVMRKWSSCLSDRDFNLQHPYAKRPPWALRLAYSSKFLLTHALVAISTPFSCPRFIRVVWLKATFFHWNWILWMINVGNSIVRCLW